MSDESQWPYLCSRCQSTAAYWIEGDGFFCDQDCPDLSRATFVALKNLPTVTETLDELLTSLERVVREAVSREGDKIPELELAFSAIRDSQSYRKRGKLDPALLMGMLAVLFATPYLPDRAFEALFPRFSADLLAGRRTRRGGRKGAVIANPDAPARHKEWQRRADEIWAQQPGLSVRETARLIDPKRSEAIRKHIRRPAG